MLIPNNPLKVLFSLAKKPVSDTPNYQFSGAMWQNPAPPTVFGKTYGMGYAFGDGIVKGILGTPAPARKPVTMYTRQPAK